MNSRVELIAECSTNAGGSMELAKEFIWRYAEAGADFVKFQHTRVKHLRPDDPQRDWFERAEMTVDQFAELKAECSKAGTKFLTTVFNYQDVPEVASLGLDRIKIGSGEAFDSRLEWAVRTAVSDWRVVVSCGIAAPMSTRYWTSWHSSLREFLHCSTRYPCSPITATSCSYGAGWDGWSDHAVGLDGCRAAIEAGARIIEKHVSLPNQARPIRPWEATVEEFTALRAFADEDPSRMIGRWQHGN